MAMVNSKLWHYQRVAACDAVQGCDCLLGWLPGHTLHVCVIYNMFFSHKETSTDSSIKWKLIMVCIWIPYIRIVIHTDNQNTAFFPAFSWPLPWGSCCRPVGAGRPGCRHQIGIFRLAKVSQIGFNDSHSWTCSDPLAIWCNLIHCHGIWPILAWLSHLKWGMSHSALLDSGNCPMSCLLVRG